MLVDESLVGKTVTIRGTSGEEIIGRLLGSYEDKFVIVVGEPRLVVLSNNEITLLPYLLTCETSVVPMNAKSILSIVATSDNISKEYLTVIEAETKQEVVEAELIEDE